MLRYNDLITRMHASTSWFYREIMDRYTHRPIYVVNVASIPKASDNGREMAAWLEEHCGPHAIEWFDIGVYTWPTYVLIGLNDEQVAIQFKLMYGAEKPIFEDKS